MHRNAGFIVFATVLMNVSAPFCAHSAPKANIAVQSVAPRNTKPPGACIDFFTDVRDRPVKDDELTSTIEAGKTKAIYGRHRMIVHYAGTKTLDLKFSLRQGSEDQDIVVGEETLHEYSWKIFSTSLSTDGKKVAVGIGNDHHVFVFDTQSGAMLGNFGYSEALPTDWKDVANSPTEYRRSYDKPEARYLSFSQSGNLVGVAGYQGGTAVYDLSAQSFVFFEETGEFGGPVTFLSESRIELFARSGDASRFISLGARDVNGPIGAPDSSFTKALGTSAGQILIEGLGRK